MKRFLPAAAAFLMAGCGYVGDPMPPLANVPPQVKDLAALQRGNQIIVQFTVPTRTTEGHPIPPPVRLDLRAGPMEQFEENQWAASARRIPPGAISGAVARYEIPTTGWTGKEVIFGVRVAAGNGKESHWSNFAIVPVVAGPERPSGLTSVPMPQGLRLTWHGRGTDFRVFRKTSDVPYAPVATVQVAEWTDTGVEFGTTYAYAVQSIVKLGEGREAESELSEDLSVTPRDKFPPAAPKAPSASLAPNSIELNWERSPEEDLGGYRVYRAEGGGTLAKVADVSVVPSYSDRRVEHGKTYHYAITAVDQAGNESPRSPSIDVVFP